MVRDVVEQFMAKHMAGKNSAPAIRYRLVHLAPQAIAILESLKPITGKKRHVFASPAKKDRPNYRRNVNNALMILFERGALPRQPNAGTARMA